MARRGIKAAVDGVILSFVCAAVHGVHERAGQAPLPAACLPGQGLDLRACALGARDCTRLGKDMPRRLTVLTVGYLTEEGNLRRAANEDENGVAHGARKLPGIREVPMSKGPRTDRAYVPSAHRKALQDRGNLGLGR